MDRGELLSTYAEYLLSPPIPESTEKAEGGVVPPTTGVSVEELELKRQKLELRKEELQMQRMNATTGIRETGEGRREKKTGRRAEAR